VKENFGAGGGAASGLTAPSIGFRYVRGEQFRGSNACPWERGEHLGKQDFMVSAISRRNLGLRKRRLEQVRPDSDFGVRKMSMEVTWKPRASMEARDARKRTGKICDRQSEGHWRRGLQLDRRDHLMAGERRGSNQAVGKERVAARYVRRISMKAAGGGNAMTSYLAAQEWPASWPDAHSACCAW